MKRIHVIYIIAGILLITAAVIAYVLSNKEAETPPVSNTNQPTGPAVNISTNTATDTNTSVFSDEQTQRNEAIRIAVTFTEQFGTYLGNIDSSLLKNIQPLLTTAYYTQLEKSLSTDASNATSVETQILSSDVASFVLNSSALVTVATIRRQTAEDGTETLLSQELIVEERYVEGEWKVSSSQWKPSQIVEPI